MFHWVESGAVLRIFKMLSEEIQNYYDHLLTHHLVVFNTDMNDQLQTLLSSSVQHSGHHHQLLSLLLESQTGEAGG